MKGRIPDPDKMRRIKGPKVTADQLRSAKIRVTTFLDEDVLQALKEMAGKSGARYQTLLNQLLRQSLLGGAGTILERLEKLEKAVFKKRAA
jgi:predicted DNA binding CopG/RHH family protein